MPLHPPLRFFCIPLQLDQLIPSKSIDTMAHEKPTIIYGTAGIQSFSAEDLDKIFSTLEKYNVKELDTAYLYVGEL
jgi:hypothetical protein